MNQTQVQSLASTASRSTSASAGAPMSAPTNARLRACRLRVRFEAWTAEEVVDSLLKQGIPNRPHHHVVGSSGSDAARFSAACPKPISIKNWLGSTGDRTRFLTNERMRSDVA